MPKTKEAQCLRECYFTLDPLHMLILISEQGDYVNLYGQRLLSVTEPDVSSKAVSSLSVKSGRPPKKKSMLVTRSPAPGSSSRSKVSHNALGTSESGSHQLEPSGSLFSDDQWLYPETCEFTVDGTQYSYTPPKY